MYNIAYSIISLLFTVVELAVLARVIISWLPMQRENIYVNYLYRFTEPILAPIRNMIERSSFGRNLMFDISPIIAFLLIGLLRNIILMFFR